MSCCCQKKKCCSEEPDKEKDSVELVAEDSCCGSEVMILKSCQHCGTQFETEDQSEIFCSEGCRHVSKTISGKGRDFFYKIKRKSIVPVKTNYLANRDFSWLVAIISEFEKNNENIDKPLEISLNVQGVSCVGCVWLIEKIFSDYTGGKSISISVEKGLISIEWFSGVFDWSAFANDLMDHGFRLSAVYHGKINNKGWDPFNIRLGLCAAFAMNSMLFTLPSYLGLESSSFLQGIFEPLSILFATLSFFVGGGYFFKRSYTAIKNKLIHIDLPISLGLIFAYIGSWIGWVRGVESMVYFDFVSIFAFLMLVGRWLQEYAIEKNRSQLSKATPRPMDISVIEDGNERKQEVDKITANQTIIVPRGQVIPVNSQLLDATCRINLEWINGETEQKEISSGYVVLGGAINAGISDMKLKTIQSWSESVLSRLLAPMSLDKSRNHRGDMILRIYLIAVMGVAFMGACYWLLHGQGWEFSLQVAISILVVSCPCALGVALPFANELALVKLSRVGLFVKEASLWGRLSKVKKICFDKTGTLTLERPELLNSDVVKNLSVTERRMLATLVAENLHPLARSLSEYLIEEIRDCLNYEHQDSRAVQYVVGLGVKTEDSEGNIWFLGKSENNDDSTSCILRCNQDLVASFYFGESIRQDARTELSNLAKEVGSISILSGDKQFKVNEMADLLDLKKSDCLGEQSPDQKAEWIRANGQDEVMMIGDGGNDSLAFNEAGCRGTPVVDSGIVEHKADFYFMGKGLRCIRGLFQIAAIRSQAVTQVFIFAVLYNIIAVAICLNGSMNPLLAAILMPLSSIATLLIVSMHFGLRNPFKVVRRPLN